MPARRFTPGILGRLVSLEFESTPILNALREVAAAGRVRLSYSIDLLPADQRVTLARQTLTLGEAFRYVLKETDLDVVVSPAGYVIVVQSPWEPHESLPPRSSAEGVSRVDVRPMSRPQVMDRVIVMGTVATGASERSLATSVTVLTPDKFMQHGLTHLNEVFHTAIPGIVAWDLGVTGPLSQVGAVRGSSSFTANYLKTYVDGVELASPYLLFAIDPFSIERIEVIRGPQGSALYGSDAISGVVQVVTRRGSATTGWRPNVDVATSVGVTESQYAARALRRQQHSAFALAGKGTTSLGIGGTYQDAGGIVNGGGSRTRGSFAGFRTLVGSIKLDGSLRYSDIHFTAASNPLLRALSASVLSESRPGLESQRIETETYGVTADHQLAPWWRQTLILGFDHHAGSIAPQREPATVADALLGATREDVQKGSLRYSSVLRYQVAPQARADVTLGYERSRFVRERGGFTQGSQTERTSLYRDVIDNVGVFAQARFDVNNSLFLAAGVRSEDNSNFGQNYGRALAPMLGASVTRDVGGVSVKLRSAYGRGIRPPQPSMRRAIQAITVRQLANPDLRPETQAGVEAGVELYVGDHLNLSLTGYRQDASGLIQQVIASAAANTRTIQYQNVGRIHNGGLELEASGRAGQFRADVTVSLTSSRVAALSPEYSGDLVVGDRVPEVPQRSGVLSVTYEQRKMRTTLGATFVGPWIGYDWLRYYTDGILNPDNVRSLRDYLGHYRALYKPYLGAAYSFRRNSEGYLRVDNLTNLQRFERDNLQITAGRSFSLGLRITP